MSNRVVDGKPERPVVVLTGASRGLGLAIARHLERLGRYRLVLTARESSLPRFSAQGLLQHQHLWIAPLDVTKDAERVALVDAITERWGRVDVLINNAGVMMRAVVEHVQETDRLYQMNVNHQAPIELTRLVLPGMRNRRFGRIINVSSVGGMMAMPTMSVYSASKFALEGVSEALRYEVRPWNIYVTLLQPGFINSDSFEQVQMTAQSRTALQNENSPYHAHYKYMAGFIARIMRIVPSTPESVAAKVVKVIEQKRPPLRVSGTIDAFLFAALRRLLPQAIYHEILYRALPGISQWGKPSRRSSSLPPPQ